MYAVVKYMDYRKEQSFEVIMSTDDLEYAKKVAFQTAKNAIPRWWSEDSLYKITSLVEHQYLRSDNKTIISYKVIEVVKCKNKFKMVSCNSILYEVLKLNNDIGDVEEIDQSLICDDHYPYGYKEEDDSDKVFEENS